MALSLVAHQRRRYMLEDSGAALTFLAAPDLPTPSQAQRAALEVFGLAAAVWREYLPTFAASFEPDTAALNLHAWAASWASIPQALPLPDSGTAAAWQAVSALAAMTAGPGFADGEPEDLLLCRGQNGFLLSWTRVFQGMQTADSSAKRSSSSQEGFRRP